MIIENGRSLGVPLFQGTSMQSIYNYIYTYIIHHDSDDDVDVNATAILSAQSNSFLGDQIFFGGMIVGVLLAKVYYEFVSLSWNKTADVPRNQGTSCNGCENQLDWNKVVRSPG